MNNREQTELMIRLEESVKHIGEDIVEIKDDIKHLYSKLDSFENTLSEHKMYMTEHPVMCLSIAEVKAKLNDMETVKRTKLDIFNKLAVFVNAALIIYLTYKGVF